MKDSKVKAIGDNLSLKVIGPNILVRKVVEQKFGNLLIISNSADSHIRGIVCGLGTGIKDGAGNTIPFHVKIGDEVFLPKYKGSEIRLGEDVYIILNESELIAIIEEKN